MFVQSKFSKNYFPKISVPFFVDPLVVSNFTWMEIEWWLSGANWDTSVEEK